MYSEEQLKGWMEEIGKKSDNGLLEIFVTDDDPLFHVRNIYKETIKGRTTPRSMSILDVGCGTGEFMFQLQQWFPHADVEGVNLFETQLSYGNGWNEPYVHIKDFSSSRASEGMEGKYDYVFCNYTLGHMPNINVFMENAFSVLKPQGLLACWDIFPRRVLAKGKEFLGYRLRSSSDLIRCAEAFNFDCPLVSYYTVPEGAHMSQTFLKVAEPEVLEEAKLNLRPGLFVARKIDG